MKRVYQTPKVKYVDFTYDEQVTAASGNTATYGDPQEIGRCQQSSETSCVHFWNDSFPGKCEATPWSLRDMVGF